MKLPFFSGRWFRSRLDATLARRELTYRPRLEPLEERIMLDAGLPPALVVGRTLSAYFVGGVQNNQETITFTVYNEQADPETGVLLTDTLQPGVTFQSASQLPDQQGQNLAWSLGTIQGFDRASVTLTVNLPGTIPVQLDTGAAAFATLNAGMVTNSTPAAVLRAGNVSDPSLLAATPDTDATDLSDAPNLPISDPFIQEEAAALGYNAQNIFNFLVNDIGYNSYSGSVRGARGTLWSNAGNTLDVASLGVALMRASGIPAQYVSGTLSQGQAQQLILSMFPASFQTVGYIPAGTQTADPANDPQLLAETESHYWFQFDTGSGMMDADPLMAGATIGQNFTASAGTFVEVPDNLREKTEVKLTAEIYSQTAALFYQNPYQDTVVLDQTFNDVNLVGRPLSIGFFVNQDAMAGFGLAGSTNTYSPYIQVGDEAFPDPSRDELIRGQDFQENLTNYPLGSQILTGLFLNITLGGPQGAQQTYQETLVDRIGFAARNSEKTTSTSLAINTSGPPILSDLDLWTINALPGLQSPQVLGSQLDELSRLQNQFATLQQNDPLGQADTVQREIVSNTNVNVGILFASASDQVLSDLEAGYHVKSYYTAPRLLITATQQTGNQVSVSLDLLKNDTFDVAYPGQVASVPLMFEVIRGFFESTLEGQIVGDATGEAPISISEIFQALASAGGQLVEIDQSNLQQLNGLPLSDTAKARITQAVNAGLVVYTPSQMVVVNGQTTVGWLEIDWSTGHTISVMENGGHQALIEYKSLFESTANNSAAQFIGQIEGYALTQINFIAEVLKGLNGGETGNNGEEGNGSEQPKTFAEIIKEAKIEIVKDIIKEALTYGIEVSAHLPVPLTTVGVYKLFLTHLAGHEAAGLAEQFDLGFILGALVGLAWIESNFPDDPEAFPFLSTGLSSLPPPSLATTALPMSAGLAPGSVSASVMTGSVSVANQLTASWDTSGSGSSFLASALNVVRATVKDAAGAIVGSGGVALATVGTPLSIAGTDQYSINGTGDLSFYGPSETSLGVSGNWTNYTASVTGNLTLTLTTASLMLNGTLLPAGTYTITTTAATLSGSGLTTSPNFSGSVSINATSATINLGAGTGNVTVGGNPLDLANGGTLDGYTGSITVGAGGANNLDDVTLNGNTANALTVSATPAALTTDQNTPVTFQANVNTSFADTYNLTGQAPPGWIVTIDSAGKVTATPAPGLQSGTYPIQIIAQSQADPNLEAQATVLVTITPTAPGETLNVVGDPLITVPFAGAQVPTAFQVKIDNTGPAQVTENLAFVNVPSGFTLASSASTVTISAGQTGIVGVYLIPMAGSQLPAAGSPESFTVAATNAANPADVQQATEDFTMPAVYAVSVSGNPTALSTTPGSPATDTLTLTNDGNVAASAAVSVATASGVTVATSEAPVTIPIGQSVTQTVTLTPGANTPNNTTLSATVNVGPPVTQKVLSVLSVTPNPGTLVSPGATVDVAADIYAGVLNARPAQVQYTVTDSNGNTVFTSTPVPINLGSLPQTTTLDLGSFATTSLSAGAYTITVNVEETSGQVIAGATGTALLTIGEPVTGSLTINSDTATAGANTAFSTLTLTNQTQSSQTVTAEVDVPTTGATLNTGSFSIPPNQIVTGANAEKLIWNLNLAVGASQQITWNSTIANLQAGQVQPVALGGSLSFVNNGTNVQTALPPLAVAGLPTEPNTTVSLQVVSSQVLALALAADAAAQDSSNAQLAQALTAVQNDVAQLQTSPTSATILAQLQFDLGNVSTLLSADPALAPFVSQLQPIQNDASTGDVTDLLNALPTFFSSLTSTLTIEATQQFTVSLTPNVVDAEPGQSKTLSVQLTNTGNDPVALNLSVTGLPANVTAGFSNTQVTLAAGASDTETVTVSNTLVSSAHVNLEVTAAASLVQHSATAIVDVQPAVADVLSVTVNPTNPNAGDPVAVTAQVFNAANVARAVLAHIDILDLSGNVVATPPEVSFNIVPGAGNLTLDLGQVSTTGLATGVYSLRVSLRASDDTPLPGQSSQTIFTVGQLATASVTASPSIVPPGTSTVATDISVTNNTSSGQANLVVTDNLPASGYNVNSSSISPAATSASSSAVVWNGQVAAGTTSQFQLSGTVTNMAPGEVRQLSTGTTVTTTVGPAPTIYNAAADFSVAANPNGVWSYGWTPTLGGALTLDADSRTNNNGTGTDGWFGDLAGDGTPAVTGNPTSTDIQVGSQLFPAGQLAQHPGAGGQDSIVRWTAPGDGTVSLKAIYTGGNSVGTTTDVHVLHNGTSIFDGEVTGFGLSSQQSFLSQPITVAKGDTIDFAVGFGTDGNYGFDSTISDLTVTFTPGATLYITSLALPGIQEVNTATGAVTNVFTTPSVVDSLIFDNSGDIIYSMPGAGQVGLYNPHTGSNTIIGSGFNSPQDLALDPSGTSVLVSGYGNAAIYRINLSTHAVTDFSDFSSPVGIAYDNAGNLFAVSYIYYVLVQLNPTTGAVIQAIPLHSISNCDGITFDPVSGAFWIADNSGGLIKVTNYLTAPQVQEFFSPIPLGGQLFDGVESDGVGDIYIAGENGGNRGRVYEYNIATNTFTALTSVSIDDLAPLVGGGSQQVTQTINLPPVTVAAEHIISLAVPIQSVDRNTTVDYSVVLTNPLPTDATYNLSLAGLPGYASNLPASVVVPAGQTVDVPLQITLPVDAIPGSQVFEVDTTTSAGASDAVEGQLTVAPTVALQSFAVNLGLTPPTATAGQGTSASYTVTVTNIGNVTDTYNLAATGLPAGVTASFSPATITVPPGQSNFRDVTLTLTPAPGTAATAYPFTVTAVSPSSAATAMAQSTLTVLANGVSVALSPGSGPPGTTFQMTVTNTGTVTDTYNLALAGPAALVATLGQTTVTLAPGAAQQIAITTGAVNFAIQGGLPLTATATSQTNAAVVSSATAALAIPATVGMVSQFSPAAQTLVQVGPTSFLLLVQNTGNVEDAFSATITGATGPVTANIMGLDGQPAQAIPIFRLPGLSSGAILLQANVTAPESASVTVKVASLEQPNESTSSTADITFQEPTTTTVASNFQAGSTYGQIVTFTATVSAGTGTPTGQVQFQLDGSDYGKPVTLSGGVATLAIAGLSAATHSIVAIYTSDNANYSNSDNSKSPVQQAVALATPTVTATDTSGTYSTAAFAASAIAKGIGTDGTLASSPNSALTFTYYVGSSATGSGSPLVPVNVGTYTVVAHYAGGGNYAAADSQPVSFTITKAGASVTAIRAGGAYSTAAFGASAIAKGVGTDGTLASSPNSGLTFTYYVGSSAVGSGSAAAPINAGTYTVVAHYAGGGNYAAADSQPVTFSIAKATPTVTATDAGGTYSTAAFAASARAQGVGTDGTLASSPNHLLTFTYYVGSSANGTGSSAAPINAGTYTAVAHYAGNGNYFAASSQPVTFTVAKATPTLTASGGIFDYDGQAHAASGSVRGIHGARLGTPKFTYKYPSGKTSATPPTQPGTYTVTASFAGNADYVAVTKICTLIILVATSSYER